MSLHRWSSLSALLVSLAACGSDPRAPGGLEDYEMLDIALCAPELGGFTADVDNPYFPLPVGARMALQGEEEGTLVRVEITVFDAAETVAGIDTRVVEEREWEGGELIEVSRNFFAQAADGTVCYFGEDVDMITNGVVTSHDGAWRAGENGNLPGIMMPAVPRVDTAFHQEHAPGVAEDMTAITGLGASISVPAGDFSDTVETYDWNPLEDAGGDVKVYVRGIGLAVDGPIALESF